MRFLIIILLMSWISLASYASDHSDNQVQDKIVERFFTALNDLYAHKNLKLSPGTKQSLGVEICHNLKIDGHLRFFDDEGRKKALEIIEIISSMSWLKVLAIKNCGLPYLPDSLANLSEITELNISGNDLEDLPSWIGHLKHLKYLNITRNKFQTLPDILRNLPLRQLYIGDDLYENNRKKFDEFGYIPVDNGAYNYIKSIYNTMIDDIDNNGFFNLIFPDVPSDSATSPVTENLADEKISDLVKKIVFNDQFIENELDDIARQDPKNDDFFAWKKLRESDKEIFSEGPPIFIEPGQHSVVDADNNEQIKTIVLKDQIPIGYTLLFPKSGIIEATVFKVYGGGRWGIPFHRPLDKHLLRNNIAIIYINALDIFSLKTFQLGMEKDLYEKIHLSINRIFNAVKNYPGELGIDYRGHNFDYQLRARKKYLFGSSFGSALVLRHEQMYKDTFDGYIGSEGRLTGEFFEQACSYEYSKIYRRLSSGLTISSFLDPSRDDAIKQLTSSTLVIQNLDDNICGFLNGASFRTKAHALGKKIDFLFYPRSSPTPKNEIVYKGHYFPAHKKHYDHLLHGLISFLRQGTLDNYCGKIHDWEIDVAKIYSDAFINPGYKLRSLKDKFFSWALRLHEYQKHSATEAMIISPSWDAFSIAGYDESHLYDALAFFERKESIKLGDISVDAVLNMLRFHLYPYIDYINELHDTNLSANALLHDLENNISVIEKIRNTLINKDLFNNHCKDTLLQHIYLFNPSLIKDFTTKMMVDKEYQKQKNLIIDEFQKTITSINQKRIVNPAYIGPTNPVVAPKLTQSKFIENLRVFCKHYYDVATTKAVRAICQRANLDGAFPTNLNSNDVMGSIRGDLKNLRESKSYLSNEQLQIYENLIKNIYE